MARVRADPVTTALAHPTRRALYLTLAQTGEMSTVQLQGRVDVERYNLYHHLKKLATLGLIENHRDVGRARWWKKLAHVELPELLSMGAETSPRVAQSHDQTISAPLPEGLAEELSNGSEIHVLHLEGSRDQIGAKRVLQLLAEDHGIELNLPWNFLPDSIALIAKKK